MKNSKRVSTRKLTLMALMIALSYIGFQYLRIDIPIGGSSTAIHLGNTFCVLGALLLGGLSGGLSGAIGLSMADLMIPAYAPEAPKTFFLKFMISLITGLVAHKIAKINEHSDNQKHLNIWVFISATAGMTFNVIFAPITSYFYKQYILGVSADSARIFATMTAGATLFNAITSVIIASLLYLALRKAINNNRFFKELIKN